MDCAPSLAPEEILRRYREDADKPGFDLSRFVGTYFTLERTPPSEYVSDPGQGLVEHIDGLWDPPDGWAPLQWMAVHGLRKYRENRLAGDIAIADSPPSARSMQARANSSKSIRCTPARR
ncbi:hypothetical protein MB84_21310 [Pandoraea oxalativorans]|uniref:Uncharacterized protein n=1 Tax=Pandoraea oxalativorans TaxID=573737 RepID=A0A0E3U859_9BURK|nr:hypothetical protein MB84_21310 [Pandoraea oxalativorans]